MPGTPVTLGPFVGGLHNSAGTGEFIKSNELFDLVNLEVDTDGSLANRPAIADWITVGRSGKVHLMGTFTVQSDRRYIALYDESDLKIKLINADSGYTVSSNKMKPGAVVQYQDSTSNNALFVIPFPGSGDTGGYFDNASTPAWHNVADLPEGQTASIYNERMWIGAGIDSVSDNSRVVFSAIGDFSDWDARDFVDVVPGNGQKLTSIRVVAQDLMIFKEHSTFRAGYTSDVKKIEVINISRTVGTPSDHSVAVYDNNNIYMMHDNSVYEVFNFSFSKISGPVRMHPEVNPDMYEDENYGLTVFRDRLFVRYFDSFYVYSLVSETWSRWETEKNFSFVVTLPIPEGDVAFAHSATKSRRGHVYRFTENRVEGVREQEEFSCKIVTKTYDFTTNYAYKVLFWWAADLATLATTKGTVSLANAGRSARWSDWFDARTTWQDLLDNSIPWSTANMIVYDAEIFPELGQYGKKILKFPKKLRFRQLYFSLTTDAIPNDIADTAVRIYGLTAFVSQKERVVRKTT